ncbi:MAG: hypothetical protein ACREPJ_01925 [Rhodanobacteraceae bacterium]
MRRLATRCVWSAAAILAVNAPAIAGPPFLTDDPVPVPYRHNEFYTFGTLDHADGSSAIAGPAIEYNRGVAPDVQFHVVVPFAWNVPSQSATASGDGDIELGIKYRS